MYERIFICDQLKVKLKNYKNFVELILKEYSFKKIINNLYKDIF